MAFWTHFTLQSASSIFLLLWGFPYLVEVQGFTAPQASWFLGLLVVFALIFGRVTGYLATRLPHRRSTLVIVSTAAVVLMWMVLLANPGPDAFAAVVCLGLVLSAAATVSILAFDFTRKHVPETQLGVANGITNIGGFLATLSAVFLVGLVTDSASISGPRFDASQLEIGLWILPGTALLGLIFFVLEDKKARKVLSPAGRENAFFIRGLRKKPKLHQK
jgi:sugar phosphate permease